jgi:hypothetical protein
MLRLMAMLLSASLATASWVRPQEVSTVALPAAGGTISGGPYTCTTSIGTVDGAVSAKAGSISVRGGFICVEPYYNTTCVADVDQSGSIDSGDVSILLLLYGPAIGPFKFADLDRSGFIDTADLSLVLLSYGEDCTAQSLTGDSNDPGGQLVMEPAAVAPQSR